jgi:glycosyltransferase involved in cell wall biosynthesis
MRRLYRPFVHRYVALSQDLAGYLTQGASCIAAARIEQIYNGVDTDRFRPGPGGGVRADPGQPRSRGPAHWLVGTVGRMQTVKHQPLLARAFVRALSICSRRCAGACAW